MRDNAWLKEELHRILKQYFADVTISNPIEIKFGREAKYRFGSIKLYRSRGVKASRRQRVGRMMGFGASGLMRKEPEKSVITVTSMFKSEDVPLGVLQYTVCHELCHYAHGFSSYNKRLFKYPHHGGVVNREIKKRGGAHLIESYKKWLKDYRKEILAGRA